MTDAVQPENLYQLHRVFEPPPPTAKLWRYSDLAKLVSVLGKRALYFPLASNLDDPYEGMLPRILAATLPRDILPVMARARVTNFVSCWHHNNYESAAMWQIYAKYNEGVAIQSTFSRLTSSFVGFKSLPHDIAPPTAIYAGTVHYIDYERENLADKHWALNGFSVVMHKRRSFAHENEVRAVFTIPLNCSARGDLTPRLTGTYVDCDMDRLVEAVYVSPLAPAYFRDAVEMVLNSFNLKVPVIQSDLMSKPLY